MHVIFIWLCADVKHLTPQVNAMAVRDRRSESERKSANEARRWPIIFCAYNELLYNVKHSTRPQNIKDFDIYCSTEGFTTPNRIGNAEKKTCVKASTQCKYEYLASSLTFQRGKLHSFELFCHFKRFLIELAVLCWRCTFAYSWMRLESPLWKNTLRNPWGHTDALRIYDANNYHVQLWIHVCVVDVVSVCVLRICEAEKEWPCVTMTSIQPNNCKSMNFNWTRLVSMVKINVVLFINNTQWSYFYCR